MGNMVSMKDIAAACGVSVATVSKALGGHRDIGEETKARIRQAAKEMGYSPNAAAKSLKTRRTYNLGVLFVDEAMSGLTHDYFASVLDSFKRAAEERGYDITFINCCKTRSGRMSYLEHSRYRMFDGVVIACIDFSDPEVEELVRSEIPVVTIDYLFNDRCAVISDNIGGMRNLVTYIYGMRHRRIAYIHGADSAVTRNRLSSFYATCEQLGIDVPAQYIREAPYRDTERTYAETEALLGLKTPPTCILYPDDFSCMGGISAILGKGMRIPEDISVAGYDGARIAGQLKPRLTTWKQDTEGIGRRAAEKLVSLVERPKVTLTEQIVVTGELVAGESVGRGG